MGCGTPPRGGADRSGAVVSAASNLLLMSRTRALSDPTCARRLPRAPSDAGPTSVEAGRGAMLGWGAVKNDARSKVSMPSCPKGPESAAWALGGPTAGGIDRLVPAVVLAGGGAVAAPSP
ncbi:hypothetical protein PF008_g23588 [Phytophthora fragariae]|uniref:Uncharacterized protein n=1 Tax=Phytophthora fragariae TaxID=53985 RepID=A0A6G0QQJ2_9STRA|nr:hypothetical protein PF008_g23588 [Phytophthora fragariae]